MMIGHALEEYHTLLQKKFLIEIFNINFWLKIYLFQLGWWQWVLREHKAEIYFELMVHVSMAEL